MSTPAANANATEIGQSDQVLIGSKRRVNYKKYSLIVFGSLIAIAVICVIVYFVIDSYKEEDDTDHGEHHPAYDGFTLDDYFAGKLSVRGMNGVWISDNELMYRDRATRNIVKYNALFGTETVIADVSIDEVAKANDYKISPDNKYLLIATQMKSIFRHSTTSLYHILDIEKQTVTHVTVAGKQEYLHAAIWAPVGSSLAFVYEFDIYYMSGATANEIRLTTDGTSQIRNGVCDWVYEEEVFSTKEALWFSTDASEIAYITFDDTLVRKINIPRYGRPGSIDDQYPHELIIDYPKSGAENPKVLTKRIVVKDLKRSQDVKIVEYPYKDPKAGTKKEKSVIVAVTWKNANEHIEIRTDRIQTEALPNVCSSTSNCMSLKEMFARDGWIEFSGAPLVNKAGSHMLVIQSQPQGENGADGGYRHLTLVSIDANSVTLPLTKGKFVVKSIYHWDQKDNIVFYSATTETHSQHNHIYAVKAEAGQEPRCITCDRQTNNVTQTYFSARFSKTGNHILMAENGPSVPRVDIYSWELLEDGDILLTQKKEWETNPEMHEYLKKKAAPAVHYHDIKLSSGYDATVRLQFPPHMDTSGKTKYPMIVHVYAGPNSYAGDDRFDLSINTVMSSNSSLIVAQINGRGSAMRGDKLLFEIYKKLGTVEIEDQIETTKKLTEQFKFIDKERIAIWGWSYGGYASAMVLAQDEENVFACAAAVAPVTDWLYYDTIYTERYMDLPDDNKEGYDNGRLSTLGKKFAGKKFFLIHGTLDDNVHFQNSMALSRSLEENDVQFTQMSYVDENHGIGGTAVHLYHSLGRFFGDCLQYDRDLLESNDLTQYINDEISVDYEEEDK